MRGYLAITVWIVAACSYHGRAIDDASAPDVDGPRADSPPGTIDAGAIDASPPDAHVDARPCPTAPAGCTAFSCGTASCSYVCAARGWTSARDHCQSDGVGCLATIDDDGENTCIAAATNPAFPDLVWLGFVQSPSGSEPGGGWGWQCGSSSYTAPNWGMFEPNNSGGNEDCGAMNAGGVWIDGDCATSLRYVCEVVP